MEPITQHAQLEVATAFFGGYTGKVIRFLAYLVVAALLMQANTYPISGKVYVALSIAALGLTSNSARIGQLGLAVLLLMALFPYDFVTPLISG